jgi:hypothetical protein
MLNRLNEEERVKQELEKAKEETQKAMQMVVDKKCEPPKPNSKFITKLPTQDEFLEPLPVKKAKLTE